MKCTDFIDFKLSDAITALKSMGADQETIEVVLAPSKVVLIEVWSMYQDLKAMKASLMDLQARLPAKYDEKLAGLKSPGMEKNAARCVECLGVFNIVKHEKCPYCADMARKDQENDKTET